jgi:cysteine synthase A
MKIAKNITQLIGNTPLIELTKFNKNKGKILGKCEFLNPISSIKDRVAMNIIQQGIKHKLINKNTTIIEATSGNTGIALSSIASSLNLKMVIFMPESMSIERIKLMEIFGAKVILTPASQGMNGAVKQAQKLHLKIKNSYLTSQFDNRDNPKTHEKTTAKEIIRDTKVDIFVAGIGTGGTISGVGKYLKKINPNIKIIGVKPKEFNHKIQGIGANFIPKNLNLKIIDEVIQVTSKQAIKTAKKLARKEGILVGISSGANVFASQMILKKEKNRGKIIVTTLNDTGERYLSTELFVK